MPKIPSEVKTIKTGEDIKKKKFVTSEDLHIYYGFSYYQARKIIREGKIKLVRKGITHYDNCRISYLPHDWIRKDLGLDIEY